MLNDAPRREQFSGPSVYVLFVFFWCFRLVVFFFLLCSYYFSSELDLINLSLLIFFFFSFAAINQRPYDCMRSAGEDGGFERVFIERLTNTN